MSDGFCSVSGSVTLVAEMGFATVFCVMSVVEKWKHPCPGPMRLGVVGSPFSRVVGRLTSLRLVGLLQCAQTQTCHCHRGPISLKTIEYKTTGPPKETEFNANFAVGFVVLGLVHRVLLRRLRPCRLCSITSTSCPTGDWARSARSPSAVVCGWLL